MFVGCMILMPKFLYNPHNNDRVENHIWSLMEKIVYFLIIIHLF